MYIKSIKLENTGCFSEKEINLLPGVNVLLGANGTGKTTVLAALYSMFKNGEVFQCNGNREGTACIRISVRDRLETISFERRYKNGSTEIAFDNIGQVEKLAGLEFGNIFLCNGENLFHGGERLSIHDIKRAVVFMRDHEMDIPDKYEKDLDEQEYYLISSGEQAVLKIFSMLSLLPDRCVFLMDAIFSKLDSHMVKCVLEIMKKMSGVQFIITMGLTLDMPYAEMFHVIPLSVQGYERHYIGVDYSQFSEQYRKEPLFGVKAGDISAAEEKIIKYQLNTVVEEEENRNMEFKEIKGKNPCDTIVDTAEIYIIAFLNSWTSGRGTIKWGIDNGGVVKGVRLTREDRDVIRRKITDRLSQVQPHISPDIIYIDFQKIIDEGGRQVPDTYVVEISVEEVWQEPFFATSKNEVYIKTESGKRKLTIAEVQEEYKKRLGR